MKHPERVPPWSQLLDAAGDERQSFVSSALAAVGQVSMAVRGTPVEEIPASSELVTWPMYRTVIGEGSRDEVFWRQLYWLFRQEQQLENMRKLKEEGWELG